ncbi:hypothetical protein C8R44DRAFT_145387 [Mycena epipterygia]|nr:hypothetical protein C8R44DRAFT_145387 [Mycena epipterygia]
MLQRTPTPRIEIGTPRIEGEACATQHGSVSTRASMHLTAGTPGRRGVCDVRASAPIWDTGLDRRHIDPALTPPSHTTYHAAPPSLGYTPHRICDIEYPIGDVTEWRIERRTHIALRSCTIPFGRSDDLDENERSYSTYQHTHASTPHIDGREWVRKRRRTPGKYVHSSPTAYMHVTKSPCENDPVGVEPLLSATAPWMLCRLCRVGAVCVRGGRM